LRNLTFTGGAYSAGALIQQGRLFNFAYKK